MSDTTAFRTGFRIDRAARLILLARLALLWERVWPNLWPASGFVGAFIAAALLGLFAQLDWQIHAMILSALFAAILISLYRGFENFAWPSWSEGARRIERDSTLSHRPLTEGADRLAAGKGDPIAETFWRAHLERLLSGLARLRLSLPSPGLSRRDPYALRFLVLLAVIGGIVVAGPDWRERISAALQPNAAGAFAAPTLDAWISPPAYTGEAPLYLRRGQGDAPIAVPAGSILSLRVHGASYAPDLSFISGAGNGADFTGGHGDYGTNIAIRSNAEVQVKADGLNLGSWRIRAISDIAPVIAFAGPPSRTERDALKLSFTAGDDYGVTSVRAIIRPVAGKRAKPLVLDLPLSSQGKTVTQTVYRDLTGHPYAGSEVDITLVATDAIGQTGKTRPVRMRLPARIFTNPLARALIEQRQQIATGDKAARRRAAMALDALTVAPELFYPEHAGIYLALRTAFWTLKNARGEADDARVQDILWQTALALEQGGLSLAAQQLRELQQMISQALARGAPPDEINALLQRYQQAMQRYLQSLAQNPPPANAPLPPDAKMLSPQDLDTLLKAIQQLAQTGNREQAQQLMQLLQNLLENMRLAEGQGGGQGSQSPQGKAMSDAIQGLGDLMGRQRGLLDKTFRQQQGAGDPKDGGPKGLAGQQNQLRQDLNKILQGLGGQKIPVPDSLSRAGRAMGNSEQALNGQDLQGSGNEQQNALDALRQGADALAKSLMQQMGQQGQNGQNEDPLGRAQGSRGGSFGSNVKIPDQSDLERAREILQELRKRAAERGRPQEELDYIDRLLKEF